MSTSTKTQSMDAAFFDEYTSHDAILKYTRATAGYGISHLLDRDYRYALVRRSTACRHFRTADRSPCSNSVVAPA